MVARKIRRIVDVFRAPPYDPLMKQVADVGLDRNSPRNESPDQPQRGIQDNPVEGV